MFHMLGNLNTWVYIKTVQGLKINEIASFCHKCNVGSVLLDFDPPVFCYDLRYELATFRIAWDKCCLQS